MTSKKNVLLDEESVGEMMGKDGSGSGGRCFYVFICIFFMDLGQLDLGFVSNSEAI